MQQNRRRRIPGEARLRHEVRRVAERIGHANLVEIAAEAVRRRESQGAEPQVRGGAYRGRRARSRRHELPVPEERGRDGGADDRTAASDVVPRAVIRIEACTDGRGGLQQRLSGLLNCKEHLAEIVADAEDGVAVVTGRTRGEVGRR